MSQELKPCPFCGSTNLNVTAESSYVMCYGCDADGPVTRPSAAAIAAWNNRPAPVPPAGGEVEVLAVVDETDGVFPETLVTHRDAIDAAPVGTELIDRTHVTRLQAENAALQQRLNVADQRIDDLEQDKARLDSIEANYWDVRHHSTPIADTGDHSTSIEIVGHWMDKPHERVIGENYNENLRASIDQAMAAPAYPPARPEYPEIDALLDAAVNP